MKFIKQCKALDSYATKLNDDDLVYTSIKIDGVYLQIHKKDNIIKLYTSNGKEFNNIELEEQLLRYRHDFIIECEFSTDFGRSNADTHLKKMLKNKHQHFYGKIHIFDIIDSDIFENRLNSLKNIFTDDYFMEYDARQISLVKHELISIKRAKELLDSVVKRGKEGIMLKYPDHTQEVGKKSKKAIKLKPLNIADLVVTKILDNGYVILVDDSGIQAKVKINSSLIPYISIGTVIEIAFDFIGTRYNQARFIDIRFDKGGSNA